MSFIQRTLKKAEDFLESFDENVANYSRKVALESSEWEDDESAFNTPLPEVSENLVPTYQDKNTLDISNSTYSENKTQEPSTTVYKAKPQSKETDEEFTDIAFVTEDAKVVSSFRREGRPSDSFRSNEYRNQLTEITRERNGYARQLQKAKELLEELQFELGEERKRHRQLEEEKDEQIFALERKLEEVDWQLEQLGREKKDALDAYQVAMGEREERIKQLMEECSAYRQKANHLQEELERKSQEQQDLHFSVHEEIRRLSEELEKEKTSHQSTRSSYQEKVHEWEAQFFAFQEKEAEFERNLFMEQQENKTLANRIQELEYHLEMERNRYAQVQQQLESMQNCTKGDKEEKQVWMERLESLSQQLEERDERIRYLERQMATLQEREETTEYYPQTMKSDTSTVEESTPLPKEYEEKIQILEAKLKQMTDSLLEKQNQMESLRSTARVLSSQLDTERRRASQLEAMTLDSMQRNNASGYYYSTGDWNLSETSNYRPLRIRRAPRIVQKLLKLFRSFFLNQSEYADLPLKMTDGTRIEWQLNQSPLSLYYVTSPVPLKAFACFHKSNFVGNIFTKKGFYGSRGNQPTVFVAHKFIRKRLCLFCCLEKDSYSQEHLDVGLPDNVGKRHSQSKNRKQVDWEDIDEVVDGGFLNKFRHDYIEGKEKPLADEFSKSPSKDTHHLKKSSRSSSRPSSSSHFKSQQTVTSAEDNNKMFKTGSNGTRRNEESRNTKDNINTVHDISSVANNVASKLSTRQMSDTPSQEQKSNSSNRRKRKNNMYVYNMHLQQNKNSDNSLLVTHIPDDFCEAKILVDERAFNRLAASNFICMEPWKWKHFPYQERFQRLVKPESKMWIKRTNSRDIKTSLDESEPTTNSSKSVWNHSHDMNRHSSSPAKTAYHERKKKNTQWRKSTADSLSENNT